MPPSLQSYKPSPSNVHFSPLTAEGSVGLSSDGDNFVDSRPSLINFTYSGCMHSQMHSRRGTQRAQNVLLICLGFPCVSQIRLGLRNCNSIRAAAHKKIQATCKKILRLLVRSILWNEKSDIAVKTWLCDNLGHDICGCSTMTLTAV